MSYVEDMVELLRNAMPDYNVWHLCRVLVSAVHNLLLGRNDTNGTFWFISCHTVRLINYIHDLPI